MGGMHGFGPVMREDNGPVFHAEWEGRMLGIRSELQRFGRNIDRFRSMIEQIPANRYLRIPYYERWLDVTLRDLVEKGYISADTRREIETAANVRDVASLSPKSPAPQLPQVVPATTRGYARPIATPSLFAIGERVRARNMHPAGHTRLPRYVRGRMGVVTADHGGFVFPDTNAKGEGEQPKRLYTVRFTARELWGDDANVRDTVSLDLWEPYLERAS
jgi:nitrile hydratase